MTVEIWSDVMCPFCYIGKRKFENALEQFDAKENIDIKWRSFQLDPALESNSGKNLYEYLAEKKGWTLDYSAKVHEQMAANAKQLGLEYNFDKAIPANSFNAHRLSHYAAKQQLQDEMEERIFAAYFTEGKNIDDIETLVGLAEDTGLDADATRAILLSQAFAEEVEKDIHNAQRVGVRGVPFFVFDNKYAVSGAQESNVFLNALRTSWSESAASQQVPVYEQGDSCSIDGNC